MDINNLEADIKLYRSQVQILESLEKLLDNRDFQVVIMNGYLRDHVLDLVKLRHRSLVPDDNVSRSIDAVSNLMAYLDLIKTIGATARTALAESEQTLEEHYKEV